MLQLDVPEARELEHAPRHLKSADLCGREAKSQVEARNLDVGFEIHVDGKVDEVGQFSEQSREGLVDLCEAMGLVVRIVRAFSSAVENGDDESPQRDELGHGPQAGVDPFKGEPDVELVYEGSDRWAG